MQTLTCYNSSILGALGWIHRQIEKIPKHGDLYIPIDSQLKRAYQILIRMEKQQITHTLAPKDQEIAQCAYFNCVQQFKTVLLQIRSLLDRYRGTKTKNYLRSVLCPRKKLEEETDVFLIELKKLFKKISIVNEYYHGEECVQCSFRNVYGARFCGYCDKHLNEFHPPEQNQIVSIAQETNLTKESIQESTSPILWMRTRLQLLQTSFPSDQSRSRWPILKQLHSRIPHMAFEFVKENGLYIFTKIIHQLVDEDAIFALEILQYIICSSDYWMDDQVLVVQTVICMCLDLGIHRERAQERIKALGMLRAVLERCEITFLVFESIIQNNGVDALLRLLKHECVQDVRRQVYDILYLMASLPSSMNPIISGKETKHFGVIDAELPDGTSSLSLLQKLRTGDEQDKLEALELLQQHARAIAYDLIVLYAGITQLLDCIQLESDKVRVKAVAVLLALSGKDSFYREKLLAADAIAVVLDMITRNVAPSMYRVCHAFVLTMLNMP
ncbi:unnamed protein product [Albugo candida]|uniref:Uncharacterized protein n=1 Tax=Albugo candida TaxID=65357 RepID=A0A024GJN7_9STRA|nr:unnamed protein product [Albugo candida]|eukprot:CCI46742.1 unnamed protein product [Albugo candida]